LGSFASKVKVLVFFVNEVLLIPYSIYAEIFSLEIKLIVADELVGRPIIGVKTGVAAPKDLPSELAAKKDVIAVLKTALRDKGFSNQLFIRSFEYPDIRAP